MEPELLTNQDQACERAQDILFIARFTEDPMEERPVANSHTLESFIEEVYQPWAETNLRSGARTVARIRASFAEHLGRKLGELTRWTVEEWRAARIKDGVSAATVYRDLGALRSALARAVTWRLLDASPIPAVNRSKIGEMRGPRFLSDDEEGRLRVVLDDREERLRRERDKANAWRATRVYEPLPDLRSCTFADQLKPLAILSLNTEMRRAELFALTWRSVDLTAGRITLHGSTANSGKARHITLSAEALTALRGWYDQSPVKSGLVFPAKSGDALAHVRRAWESVLMEAKIERFRWHDLRHTLTSSRGAWNLDVVRVRE
jgi:integrase